MCLDYDEKETAIIAKNLRSSPTKTLTFWKVFYARKWKNQFGTGKFFQSINYPGKPIKPGFLVSHRTEKEMSRDEKSWRMIELGIHVYTIYPGNWNYPSYNIVPVECHLDDFVAGGIGNEAVFMKVKIDKKDLEKAKNRK